MPSRKGSTRKTVVQYRAAHCRVVAKRGRAREHTCVYPGCIKEAQEWALNPNAVHTYEDKQGRVWSLDTDDYQPMCCSHHRKFDDQHDDWFIDLWLSSK